MWNIVLVLIKAVGITCCLLTVMAAIVVASGIAADLKEAFRNPDWMNLKTDKTYEAYIKNDSQDHPRRSWI